MTKMEEPGKTDQQPAVRPTEPLPTNWKPAKRLFLFLLAVVASIAVVAAIIDRAIYG